MFVKLTKNTSLGKYSCFRYNIRFYSCPFFSFLNFAFAKNIIIFEPDNSYSMHADIRKSILVVHKGPAQGLGDITIKAEAEYFN